MYYCTGAQHAPHHVPKEWSDRYKGKFDDGWEAYREKTFARQKELGIVPADAELSRHDPDVQEWDSLSDDEKRLYARMMEVYAGFLTHTDHHIGRLLDFLKEIGEFDNTLVMVISDNGASSEGGPTGSVNENLFFNNVPESLEENLERIDELGGPETFNHYAWGWTWAGDTPFRRWKRETYRGGISDPFVVHWPEGIETGGHVRTQYAHAVDMVPTVLEALGIESPESIKGVTQSPIEGVSFSATFSQPDAPTRHHTQYFEMMGHRSIYQDGWRAVCPWPGPSFAEAGLPFGTPIPYDKLTDLDAKNWELYHVEEDFAENNNLADDSLESKIGILGTWLKEGRNVADEVKAKLIEMIGQWYVEAGKYNVLPVDGRGVARFAEERPTISGTRTSYTYYPGTQAVAPFAAAIVLNRSHSITAHVDIPQDDAEGALLVHGGVDSGYAFYIKDGKLKWCHNYVAREHYYVESAELVPSGSHELRFEFEVTGPPDVAAGKGAPGRAQLYIDGDLVGQADVPVTTPLALGLTSGVICGRAPGARVTPDYEPPFDFTGKIQKVIVDVSGDLIEDDEATLNRLMARQ
jgi:arylsulfatase